MKSLKKSIAIVSALITFTAPISQANAAWVVGLASSFGEKTEFNKEVQSLAHDTAMVSFVLGLVTGNAVFSTIFLLDENSTVADFQDSLIESHDFLVDSPELTLDLSKKLHHKAISTDLLDVENTKNLDLKELRLTESEINSSLSRFGHLLNSDQLSTINKALK